MQESPVSVMAQVLMERVFAPERIDKLFDTHAIVHAPAGFTIFKSSRFNEFSCMWNLSISSCGL